MSNLDRLPPSFYQGSTLELAPKLLGKELVRQTQGGLLVGRIVEVEAYHQEGDAAAHSFCGETARNRVMFGKSGHLYVYLSYGIHHCMNIVTEPEKVGAAVLIRALEPLEGQAQMRQWRKKARRDRDLANGPGKACQAFGIDLAHNGISLQTEMLYLREATVGVEEQIVSGPRIGITKATELPWRFYLANHPCVSPAKPGPPSKGRKFQKKQDL